MTNMYNQGLPMSSLLQHLAQRSEQWIVSCRRQCSADGGMSPNFVTREGKPKGLTQTGQEAEPGLSSTEILGSGASFLP